MSSKCPTSSGASDHEENLERRLTTNSEMQRALLPLRPARPMRWMYVSKFPGVGRSYCRITPTS